jgi:thioredoxin reductase (NADPH)
VTTDHPTPGPAVTAEHVDPAIPPAEHDGVRDLIIIVSGPAGYTAAIYAARANLHPLVFEGSQFGGALMTTTEVENFPGFAEGVQGPQLMDDMRTQAERFGAELVARDVTEVDLTAEPKIVKVGDEVHRAHAVIVATGSKYRYLGLDNEQRLLGRGVSACATCDGFFFRDQDIVVVGGGDSAMEEATFLTRFARSVTVIHRRDRLRASAIMQERAFSNDKVRFLWNTGIEEVLGENKMEGLRVRDLVTGEQRDLPFGGLFLAIGHDPRSDLFRGQVDLDEGGYVLVDAPGTRTNLPGVFACGDLVDHTYRQAVTAAGTGCAAALDAERWIAAQSERPDVEAAIHAEVSAEAKMPNPPFASPSPSVA